MNAFGGLVAGWWAVERVCGAVGEKERERSHIPPTPSHHHHDTNPNQQSTTKTPTKALNAVAQSYSPDLHQLCLQLCTLKPGATVFDLAPLVARCALLPPPHPSLFLHLCIYVYVYMCVYVPLAVLLPDPPHPTPYQNTHI